MEISDLCRVKLPNREAGVRYWTPALGPVGRFLAIDTETTPIEEGRVPEFVIGAIASDEEIVYLLRRSELAAFLETHKTAYFVMCNAAFDINVLEHAIGQSLAWLLDTRRVLDIGLLYQLVCLATDGALPHSNSLAHISEKYLNFILDKEQSDGLTLIRTNFGRHLSAGGVVDYETISADELRYVATDALVTWEAHKEILQTAKRLSKPGALLTHDIQIKAAYGLAKVELTGCRLDSIQCKLLGAEISEKLRRTSAELKELGWQPGTGSESAYEKIVCRLEELHNFVLPRTRTGKITSAEYHLEHVSHLPFVRAYLEYHSLKKLSSTFISKLQDKEIIYPHFRTLVSTGRTSSYNPNFQNFPRDSSIRRCFVPREGHKYVVADYSTIELCTLAQTCISRYGRSKMAELINQGVDLHRWFASLILEVPMERVSNEDRLYAKACNFGFPGGLGVRQFLNYARSTYGIQNLTFDRAKDLRTKWLDAFPEMGRYLATNPGDAFGSRSTAETITGRLRANCSYTQSRNFPFQGLAADGAKLALFRLIRDGYRVVNYIHDEFVIEVSENTEVGPMTETIREILVSEMRKIVPDVRISVELRVANSWAKS